MPRDIYRSDVRARAPFNFARAPNVRDARGNEEMQSRVIGQAASVIGQGAALALAEQSNAEVYKQQAEDAMRAYRKDLQIPSARFHTTKLSGAKDQYPEYKKTVETLTKKYGDSLHPEARKIYRNQVNAYNEKLSARAHEHMAKQFVANKLFNASQDVQLSIQEAYLNPYDPEAHKGVAAALYNEAITNAAAQGMTTEDESWTRVVDQVTAQKYSRHLRDFISSTSDKPGEGIFANEFFLQNKQYMVPDDVTAVENKARQGSIRDQGMAIAKQIFSANPDNPSRGYSELGRIQDPELRQATTQEFSRMLQIDKNALAVNRSDAWAGFHRLLDNVQPGSTDVQDQVAEVQNYMSGISDKMNNLGGTKTLKQQMQAVLDNKLKPAKKTSDAAYLAELNRMASDVETFSTMDIDHTRLSPEDAKRVTTLQQGIQKGDAKTVGAIREANPEYFGTIADVLIEQGVMTNADRTTEAGEALIDAFSTVFVDHLNAMRDQYGVGAEFLDSSTIKNINENKKLLTSRLTEYVKDLKKGNPGLVSKPTTEGYLWWKKEVEKRTTPPAMRDRLLQRDFTQPIIPERPRSTQLAPPSSKSQREQDGFDAGSVLNKIKKFNDMNRSRQSGE
jgi:hypothetical protein